MKFRIIILLVVLLSTSFTQFMFGQFESVKIIPENPTPDDNITVEYSATFSYSACSLEDYSISLQGNEVIVALKYNVGAAAALCSRVDTLTIGHLTKGNYLLITNTTDSRSYPHDVDTLYFIVGSVGTHEISESQIMDFYPNPTNNIVSISSDFEIKEINIYDVSGKIISTIISKKSNTLSIDLSNFQNGVYLVQIQSGNRSIVKKIIKI